MTALVLIGLMVAAAILWQRIDALKLRIITLELALDRGERIAREDPPARASFERFDWIAPEPIPEGQPVPEARPMPEARPVPDYVAAAAPEAAPPALAAEPEPQIAETPERPARRFGFEDIFGRYLPIWAGGITLAVAGFLIVKYSIDAGLLSPAVRVVFGMLFGSGLIAGAELAHRRDDLARDPRIRQALSGAGIATLYASVLVAANLYHLIGPMTAFAGLAAITLLAGLLSIRFGAPCAVLGLVGGLAAPALVGSTEPDLPLLASWLALTVGGLSILGRRQSWWWLGALAVAGGFGWGSLLIASGLHDVAASLSVGSLTLLLAVAFPLAIAGAPGRALRIAAAVVGCAQMAAIVATGGFTPLNWGQYALLSIAIVWLSRREAALADLPLAGLGVGALLTLAWPDPSGWMLTMVLAGGAAIYGLPALWRLWGSGGRTGDAVQIAAIGLAVVLVPLSHFGWHLPRGDFAPLALIGMAIAGVASGLGWRQAARREDARFAIVSVTAIMLATLAAGLVAPIWALAPLVAIAAVAALALGRGADDRRIDGAAQAFAAVTAVLLVAHNLDELARCIGLATPAAPATALLRWAVGAVAMAAFARWSMQAVTRRVAEAVTVLLVYAAAAQIVPAVWLALVPALMLGGMAATGRRIAAPALGVAGLLALGWAVEPLLVWMTGAGGSLIGVPFLIDATPAIDATLIRIAAPAAALVALVWRGTLPERLREVGAIAAIILSTIAVHALWKHVFAIADATRFVALGMAERTLWEALLFGAVLAAWRFGARRVAAGLGLATLLHFAWYTALLHDPLWSAQLAGPWLLPAFAIAFALVWLSDRVLLGPIADRARDGIRMGMILLLATALLRQAFHGTMLSEPGMSQAEDIGRSLTAITIAIGFLQWGIRRAARDWRIISLVLMLGAVGKVFLFDAAGLDGLLRIASFAALGFSLIGVGWLYSRYLPDAALADPALTEESQSVDTVPADTRG